MAVTKAVRKILRAKITHISLCRRGANGIPVLYKAESDDSALVRFPGLLSKMDDEGILTALVCAPNHVDNEGDVADAEAVKQMAHDFIANGANIDTAHDLQPLKPEQAQLCESFIVQKSDPRFQDWKDTAGNVVDAEGAWAVVMKIHDPEQRRLYREGVWDGVSLFGPAIVRPLSKSTKEEKPAMTPEEMKTLVAELAKALKPEPVPAPDAPVPAKVEFEGDITSPADLEKHMDKVLFASLDLSKPADILKWQGHLAKKVPAKSATAEELLAKAQADLDAATEQLAKLQKASNQPAGTPTGAAPESNSTLSKSQNDLAARMVKLAEATNKKNGR